MWNSLHTFSKVDSNLKREVHKNKICLEYCIYIDHDPLVMLTLVFWDNNVIKHF